MIIGGVVAALLGAVVLAFGAQFQNRGVQAVGDHDGERGDHGERSGIGLRQVLGLLRNRGWLLGSSLLTFAVLLQLVGLLLAPLPVVQPLGVLSLVTTALLGRRLNHAQLPRRGVVGIAASVVGVTVFVVVAAFTTRSTPADVGAAVPVLVLGGVVLLLALAGYLVGRKRLPALAFAVAGGICFGFVATLMKIVLDRSAAAVQHGSLLDSSTPFTLLVLVAAGAVGLGGISLVQTAYAVGSPDLVVAALTVIDPLVAVSLGIGLLGAAKGAPLWAFPVFVVSEAVAVFGVVRLARNPPVPVEEPAR